VNNAGTTGPQYNKPLIDMPEELWDFMIVSHLRSAFLCIKYAAPHMVKQGWGRIINTSSVHGRVGGRPTLGHYGAAKAGIVALTMTAARELGPKGINVNCVLPGTIDTPQNRAAMPKADPSRWVPPEAIARVFLFLASEEAWPINGAAIPVYGRG